DLGHRMVQQREIEDIGHEPNLHGVVFQAFEKLSKARFRPQGEGDPDLIDRFAIEIAQDLIDRSQHRQSFAYRTLHARRVVIEAANLESAPGGPAQPTRYFAPERSSADDDDPPHVVSPPAQRAKR